MIPQTFYPNLTEKVEGRTCFARKTRIRHSVYKLARAAKLIQGQHLYEAQNGMSNLFQKSALIIGRCLTSARANGVQQGMDEQRMFVKSIICGKGIMGKKIDIKGRGRHGIVKIPKCSIKIVLEEKTSEEWYKMVLRGDCPSGMANMLKTMIVQSDADFDRVKRLSFMTTSQGRHYRKVQFKRMV